jgi:3',5'-cyclic AMP phosphodiesterase CpdA
MPVAFLHLSDIHFGQEKGGRVFTHEDVRKRLLDDVALVVRELPNGRVDGIIVSGDIAYAEAGAPVSGHLCSQVRPAAILFQATQTQTCLGVRHGCR